MVDFTLTDEQKDLKELAHSFAEKEMRPVAWELDKDGTWPDAGAAQGLGRRPDEHPRPGGLRRPGPRLPLRLHHRGGDRLGLLRHRHLADGERPGRRPVGLGGSEETKKKYLGGLVEDFKLASFCLTEPDAGSDVAGMKTRAVKQGDKYILNGSKCFITNGTYADWFTVYAKTDPDAGHRGMSAFVVDANSPGALDKKEDKMGKRASNTATISFNDVEVPPRTCSPKKTRASNWR